MAIVVAGCLAEVASAAPGDGAGSSGAASWVIYVHAGVVGANDGSSWEDAFCDLQDALAVAEHGGEIWVAAGVYKPDRGTGDPWMSFELLDGVDLYGGFAGHEAHRHQRDPTQHETILSGDLLGNDDFDGVGESGCCRGGFDFVCDDQVCQDAVCALLPWCCTRPWWDEICARYAADVCCELCRPTICDNSLTVVKAIGAGLSARLDGFTIRSGVRRIIPEDIPEDYSGEIELNPSAGGGLLVRDADVSISNARFVSNAAYGGGGAFVKAIHVTFTDCEFSDNLDFGVFDGALLLEVQNTLISNCRFLRNQGRGLTLFYGAGTITGCEFRDNLSGGMLLYASSPNIVASRFVGNTMGGGLASSNSSPQLFNCDFIGNWASMRGGGVYHIGHNSTIVLVNCILNGNRAGGFVQYPGDDPSPGTGGGLYNFDFAVILNSVLTNNEAGVGASMTGGLGSFVSNSILWGNRQTSLLFDNDVEVASAADRRYNVIEDWPGDGIGNLNVDPRFVDPLGPDGIPGTEDDDLRLRPDSPLINRGDPNPAWLPAFDRDYRVRTLCGRVDIGAYEFGFADFNCDRVVEVSEAAEGWPLCQTPPSAGPYSFGCEAFDSDADGDVDLLDFAALQNELSQVVVP
jgi:hypothetical protein